MIDKIKSQTTPVEGIKKDLEIVVQWQEPVSMGCTTFRSGGERHEDSLIPEDQHAVIVDFSSRFEVLGHLVAVNVGLDQGL